jgi:uncharacterized protein
MTTPHVQGQGQRCSAAAARLLSEDVLAHATESDGVSSALETAHASIATLGATSIGLWDAGPGVDVDVELDEVFLVLAGAGTLTFADGSNIELRPGVLVRLNAGDRTHWVVERRLRKLYVA